MSTQFIEKWDQYGLMAELALRLKDVSCQFGKTVLQKLFYILQEVYRVPLHYDYTLYNYGPYSEELADDLIFLASMGGVKVEWTQGLGYRIEQADKTAHFRDRGGEFLNKYASQIDDAIKKFGSKSARDLELRSTIIYASKEELLIEQDLLGRVKDIKPHFTIAKVESAYQELVKHGFVNVANLTLS